MASEPREVELKFRLPPDRGPEALAWLAQGRPQSDRTLKAIYFDTAGCELGRAGFALRVREEDGGWEQTMKSRAAAGGKLGRGEWTSPAAGAKPDMAAVRRTPARDVLSPDTRLAALFTVTVERRTVEIRTPDSLVEAALDSGTIHASGHCAPVDELELELKEGSPEALFALATRLADSFPADLSVVAKADRGYALVEGGPVRARHFKTPTVSSRMTAGEAFRAIARAALDQILWNAELVREAPTSDAIHQTRVGLRRLRTTLKTFKSVIADQHLEDIRAGLKAFSVELDPARNLDVFIEGAWGRDAHAQGADDEAPRAAQAAAYERARRAAASPAARRSLLDTLVWIETGPWTGKGAQGARRRDRPIVHFAAASLAKGRSHLVHAGAHLARLDALDRHKVRIEAKGLRYAADVFDQLFCDHPKRGRKFLKALAKLLDDLGDLNDIATARVLAPGFSHAPEVLEREAARERELLVAAEDAFGDFKAAKPYWKT
ncbi:MAG: inorganic triphosphatase [Caulobacteraceae bacterium]|nr:inorganic triphosphatase [Caulobacteraceae bacterium]